MSLDDPLFYFINNSNPQQFGRGRDELLRGSSNDIFPQLYAFSQFFHLLAHFTYIFKCLQGNFELLLERAVMVEIDGQAFDIVNKVLMDDIGKLNLGK